MMEFHFINTFVHYSLSHFNVNSMVRIALINQLHPAKQNIVPINKLA